VVTKVVDDYHVQVEIAEGVKVKVVKSTIADIPSRTAPAQATSKRDDKREEEDEVDEEQEAESEPEETRETTKS